MSFKGSPTILTEALSEWGTSFPYCHLTDVYGTPTAGCGSSNEGWGPRAKHPHQPNQPPVQNSSSSSGGQLKNQESGATSESPPQTQ